MQSEYTHKEQRFKELALAFQSGDVASHEEIVTALRALSPEERVFVTEALTKILDAIVREEYRKKLVVLKECLKDLLFALDEYRLGMLSDPYGDLSVLMDYLDSLYNRLESNLNQSKSLLEAFLTVQSVFFEKLEVRLRNLSNWNKHYAVISKILNEMAKAREEFKSLPINPSIASEQGDEFIDA